MVRCIKCGAGQHGVEGVQCEVKWSESSYHKADLIGCSRPAGEGIGPAPCGPRVRARRHRLDSTAIRLHSLPRTVHLLTHDFGRSLHQACGVDVAVPIRYPEILLGLSICFTSRGTGPLAGSSLWVVNDHHNIHATGVRV